MASGPPKSRIFLAEDNPADVYLIEQALKENGVNSHLEVAEDGREALLFLRREGRFAGAARPELILLDLNLPQHDGTEILKRIRQDEELSSVPVVIFTSSDSPKDRFAAIRSGANHYIRKPSNLQEFMAIGATLKSMLRGENSSVD